MKKVNSYLNTAIIDADYIIWIACNPNKVLNSYGFPIKKDNKFVYTAKTVELAKQTCDSYIKDVLNFTRADSHILYLTTGETFRFRVDNSYKANRAGMEKPLWFKEVKDHLKTEWGAIEIPGLEADDLAVITLNHLENSFIIAADKDIIECVPGKHFDARRGRSAFVTTTQDLAYFYFAKSLLTGDAIDGIPNLIKGMGPKTAEEAINTRVELNVISPISAVFNIFIKTLGETEGVTRFSKQYSLLKIIDSLNAIPEGIQFSIPEPICYNCVEAVLSKDIFTLNY